MNPEALRKSAADSGVPEFLEDASTIAIIAGIFGASNYQTEGDEPGAELCPPSAPASSAGAA